MKPPLTPPHPTRVLRRPPLERRSAVRARRGGAWLGLGLLLGFVLEPSVRAEPASPEPAASAETEAVEPAEPTTATVTPLVDESSTSGPTVEDGVLPCGLRVILAQDRSLPVAAVVLAVETGTEDDPPSQPGLVHALAYHLHQGNRELAPGGAAALVHDSGGYTSLAIGPAQIRYESLVPISALDDVLWAESQRLRAPTVSAELWANTLRWARRDRARDWRTPRAAMAAAHGAAGLDHDGRAVSTPLAQMVPRAIGKAIAERFRYESATLVVVSPHPPAELRHQLEELFAELPPQLRQVRDRSPLWRTGSVPQALALPGEKGERFIWPIAPDPASVGLATVWCKAINRQRRLPGEAARARLRCHIDFDPRRPTMLLVATGVDDVVDLVQTRAARLESGDDLELVERQREVVQREWSLELRGPLPLAQRLAAAPPLTTLEPQWRSRPQRWLTGEAVLALEWTEGRRFGPHLQPGAAVHLVKTPSDGAKAKADPKTVSTQEGDE